MSIICTILTTLLWVANLFNGTGLDSVYHVSLIARIAIFVLAAVMILFKRRESGGFLVEVTDLLIFGGMGTVFVISALIGGYGEQLIGYLSAFVLVFVLAQIPFTEKSFYWTGLIYGVLGAAVLYIFNYQTALSGWNSNTIAMLGMHSFLFFVIPFYNRASIPSKVMLIVGTAVYAYLIYPTDSRSCILFMAIGAAFAINLIPRGIALFSRYCTRLVLFVPLIIAVGVVIISIGSNIQSMDAWNLENFDKTTFNGRDTLWIEGFQVFFQHLLIGTGNPGYANWHNSAVTCLVAYGSAGYLFWIAAFERMIERTRPYFRDFMVQGAVISFFVLYMQQSVELGFISGSPSLLAYIMLGMLLGRCRRLQQRERIHG